MKKIFIVVIILFSLGICRVVIAQAIDHLTIQQIRDSIFQSPHEEVGMGTGGGLPALRDSADMKAVARSPLMYVDSLLYVNPLGSPLDYPPLLLKRFPELIFYHPGRSIFPRIIDSLSIARPELTPTELRAYLQKHYPEVIKSIFDRYEVTYRDMLNFPVNIHSLRIKRRLLAKNGLWVIGFRPDEKKYLDKLGIKYDSTFFIPKSRKNY